MKLDVPMRRYGVIAVASVVLGGAAAASQANSIPDPSIELPSSTSPWKRVDSKSSLSTQQKRSGKQSLKLINDGAKAAHNAVQSNIPVAGVSPGKEYVFSVFVKGDNVKGVGGGGKPLTVLRWRNGANQKLTNELYNWAPYGSYNFTEMKLHFQAPAGAAKIDVGFRSWYDCLSGATYWDDVQLVPRVVPGRGALLTTYQAEDANVQKGGSIKTSLPDSTGRGYFDVTSNGAVLEWTNVQGGGKRVIAARYSWEGASKPLELFVNGVSQGKKQPVWTGRRGSYATENWAVNLPSGTNKVKLVIQKASGGEKIQPTIDRLEVYGTAP